MPRYEVFVPVLNPSKRTEPQERFIVEGVTEEHALRNALEMAGQRGFGVDYSDGVDQAVVRPLDVA